MPEFITVQVFDWLYGRPAGCVPARLDGVGGSFGGVSGRTDESGTCRLTVTGVRPTGGFRLVLDLDPYFAGLGIEPDCPQVSVTYRHGRTVVVHVAPFGHAVYIGR